MKYISGEWRPFRHYSLWASTLVANYDFSGLEVRRDYKSKNIFIAIFEDEGEVGFYDTDDKYGEVKLT